MGSPYGSTRPDRDFSATSSSTGPGRLPLDRLISHRLSLDRIGEAFDLLRAGSGRRIVLDLANQV